MMRNHSQVRIKLFTTIALTILMSVAFWMIGEEEDKDSVQDRQGLFFFYLLSITFSASYATVTAFPMELMMFQREQAANLYHPIPYFLVKFASELPLNVLYLAIFVFVTYFTTDLSTEDDGQIWTLFLIINIINIFAIFEGLW